MSNNIDNNTSNLLTENELSVLYNFITAFAYMLNITHPNDMINYQNLIINDQTQTQTQINNNSENIIEANNQKQEPDDIIDIMNNLSINDDNLNE